MANTVTVRFKPEIIEKLDILAKNTHRPRSYYVQQAVSNYLENYIEEIEDIADAIRINAALKSGEMKKYTLDEVTKMLEIE